MIIKGKIKYSIHRKKETVTEKTQSSQKDKDPKRSNKTAKVTRKQSKSLNFIYSNIRSLRNKFCEIESLIKTEHPDIIGLTETWLKCDNVDLKSEYHIDGYTLINKDRKDRKGGGVLLYIKNNLKPVQLKYDPNNNINLETVWVEIRNNENKKSKDRCSL